MTKSSFTIYLTMTDMDIAVRSMLGVVVGGVKGFYWVVYRGIRFIGSISTIRRMWFRFWFS